MKDKKFDIKFLNNKNNTVTKTATAYSLESLTKLWNELLLEHEGETYCIIDASDNHVIISGAMDPTDIDILEELK